MRNLASLFAALSLLCCSITSVAFERVYEPFMYFMSQGKEVKVDFITKHRGSEAKYMQLFVDCSYECSQTWFTQRLMEDFVRASQNNTFYGRYYIEEEPCFNPWGDCTPMSPPIDALNEETLEAVISPQRSTNRRYHNTSTDSRDKTFADNIAGGVDTTAGLTDIGAIASSIINRTNNTPGMPQVMIWGERRGSMGQVYPTKVCKFNGHNCAPFTKWAFIADFNTDTVTVHYEVNKSNPASRELEYLLEESLAKMNWMCTTSETGTLPNLAAQKMCYLK
ncbi:hypothetical protein [Pseudoalteromonas luteoviolacea]|uniref:hypothetical protein n=1 Tax=Pseudoalteromonas luteoviolacea TaxID=43657 RepID=UPI001B39410E|nr:hypothetical protein [Pseudoalteromonas luteoviolacea]MBQ4839690.1 hypothetical protein [Pseudoalteromonas luteoviolacea]